MNNGWDRRFKKTFRQGLRPAIESCYVTSIDGQEVEVTVYEPQVDVIPGRWILERGDVVEDIMDSARKAK